MSTSTPGFSTGLAEVMIKFARQAESYGVGLSLWEDLLSNQRLFKCMCEYTLAGCPALPGSSGVPYAQSVYGDHLLAQMILRDDYFPSERVSKLFSLTFSEEYLCQLDETFPDIGVLMWLNSYGYRLVAGPPLPLSVRDVRYFDPHRFSVGGGGKTWYDEKKQSFAHDDKVGPGWLMIAKDAFPGSLGLSWQDQFNLINRFNSFEPSSKVRVPNAAEVAYVQALALKASPLSVANQLIAVVRTTSVDADGEHVYVELDEGKVLLGFFQGDDPDDGFGIASARCSTSCVNGA